VPAALAGTVLLAGASLAHAKYPEKPVQFIVPWPPGDIEDVLTRLIADFVGGTLSIIALMLLSPLLAKVAPHFGSHESYTYAQKSSQAPELFGKGSPEGLIASEAANNVVPGPNLFQNRMDFVLALYIALLALNVIVIVFLMFSTNVLLKIIQVPTRFLGVTILRLSFVGVFTLRNSLTDCIVAVAFGLFGMILKRGEPAGRADRAGHGARRHHGDQAPKRHGAGEDAARHDRSADLLPAVPGAAGNPVRALARAALRGALAACRP